jgi:predicted acetyltransferase
MQLRVEEAGPDQRSILRNLAELYVHDFSELTHTELNDFGRFDHDFWRGCWHGSTTPYLLTVDARLAGFAIVAPGSRVGGDPNTHDLAEFFVVRRHRRRGVGTCAATELFARYPGKWEVRQRADNTAARDFWRKAIGAYTNGSFEEVCLEDERWRGWVQRFEAR